MQLHPRVRPTRPRILHVLLLALFCWLGLSGQALAAKKYHASTFDSRIEVQDDGSLRVTERIVFVFDEGTFRRVFRVIPTRRTDGIEILSASMDGDVLSQGTEAGQVEIRRRNGIRVEWHFTPVSPSTHTFELVYLARGVIRPEEGHDLLAWRALPSEHDYAIEAATIEIVASQAPTAIDFESSKVGGGPTVTLEDGRIHVAVPAVRRNGWIEPHLRFAAGSLVQAPPQWQQRRTEQLKMAPTWAAVAAGVLAAGLVLLIGLRQGYDAPPRLSSSSWSSVLPPDDLSPALAGALASNGRPQQVHAMAALFGLAERGVIAIREEAATFGVRHFTIARGTRAGNLAPHETTLLDIIFKGQTDTHEVPLRKARMALTRGWKRFRDAVDEELRTAGLIDAGRAAHQRRYAVLGFVLLALALVAFAACVPVIARFGPWPLLVPLAVALTAVASFIFSAAETPLSNDGVRRAESWRGYRQHLKHPQEAEPRWGASASAEARILPYAVALGLAAAWAKWMKKRNVQLPSWFQPASSHDGGPAFVAFVSTGGSTAHGGVAGGGGAAGGGASGAG